MIFFSTTHIFIVKHYSSGIFETFIDNSLQIDLTWTDKSKMKIFLKIVKIANDPIFDPFNFLQRNPCLCNFMRWSTDFDSIRHIINSYNFNRKHPTKLIAVNDDGFIGIIDGHLGHCGLSLTDLYLSFDGSFFVGFELECLWALYWDFGVV